MGILQLFQRDFTLNSIYKTKTIDVTSFRYNSQVHREIYIKNDENISQYLNFEAKPSVIHTISLLEPYKY